MTDVTHQTHSSHPQLHEAHHELRRDQDGHQLGVSLGPALCHQCGDRLGHIEWFRCAWQHGGAATGFATWREGRSETPVMVKLPVGSREYRWTTALSALYPGQIPGPTPRVFAAGTELGGYDLAWLVIERIPGQPLSTAFTAEAVHDLLDAAARFHEAALRADPSVRPADEVAKAHDWDGLLAKSREMVKDSGLAEAARWKEAVKKVQRALPKLKARWSARPIHTWCHGDLHPANALRRAEVPGVNSGAGSEGWPLVARGDAAASSACVLIDLAMVHSGHWIEDAVYLERLYWGRVELLHGIKPVSHLAKVRREMGLDTNDRYAEVAAVRRVLMAGCVPAYATFEGHPKYTHAALEIIEQYLPQVAH